MNIDPDRTAARGPWTWLAVILVFGFAIRLANITWGVPVFDDLVGRYHPDEWKISRAAVEFPQFLWRNSDFRYPTFFHNFNAIAFQPFRLLGAALLSATPEQLHDWSTLFARFLNAVAGTATIYLCYKLGERLMTATAGLAAASLCCVSMYHVVNSSYSTNDVLTSFFLALLMLQLIGLYRDTRDRRQFALTGITFGLLIGTKYNGAAALILVAFAYLWSVRQSAAAGWHGPAIKAVKTLTVNYLIMGAATVCAFIATTPGILVKPAAFIRSLQHSQQSQSLHARRGSFSEIAVGSVMEFVTAYGHAITAALAAAVVVIVVQTRFRDWRYFFLISTFAFVIAYTAFLGGALRARYLITIVPVVVLAIAAAWHIGCLQRSELRRKVTGALLALVLASSLVYTLLGVYSRHGDTRTSAAHFVDARLDAGAEIGVSYDSLKFRRSHPWRHPVIDFDDKFVEADILDYPEFVVISSLDSEDILKALDSQFLSSDLVWDSDGPIPWYQGDPPSPALFQFFDELEGPNSRYEEMAKFGKRDIVPISFPSPDITVYRRRDAAPGTGGETRLGGWATPVAPNECIAVSIQPCCYTTRLLCQFFRHPDRVLAFESELVSARTCDLPTHVDKKNSYNVALYF